MSTAAIMTDKSHTMGGKLSKRKKGYEVSDVTAEAEGAAAAATETVQAAAEAASDVAAETVAEAAAATQEAASTVEAVAEAAAEKVQEAVAAVQEAIPAAVPEEAAVEAPAEAPAAELVQDIVQEAVSVVAPEVPASEPPPAEVAAPLEEITKTEAEAEPAPEAPAEPAVPEPEPETVIEKEAAAVEEPITEPAPEPVGEPEPEAVEEPAVTEPESAPEPVPEIVPAPEPEPVAAPEDTETTPVLQAEVEAESLSAAVTDAEEAVTAAATEPAPVSDLISSEADNAGAPSEEEEVKMENGDCEIATPPALEQNSESQEQVPEPAAETVAEECVNGIGLPEEPPKEQTDCELKKDWELPEPIAEVAGAVSAGVNQVVDLV
ncbi:hypothetical protein JZ751_019466 [Albula glossodonta]|uniref:Uncharacterized protein n=1 Tax=Albula glossodonta TaxID=121402 RepID=A0A8T2NQ99_9TELE|nr:hypothetical protein JZ751_019466 [Albula glossodonta]